MKTLALAIALTALLLSGCGGPSDAPEKSSGVVTIELKLQEGGFARSTPRTIAVAPDALITVKVKTDGDGPYRFSVLSPSTAQTFKLTSNDSLNLTLTSLKTGDSAKLIVGRATVKVVARANS